MRQTLRHVLDVVAVAASDWLRALAPPAWLERDHRRSDEYRLPQAHAARPVLADRISAAGAVLLRAVTAPEAPTALRTPSGGNLAPDLAAA